MASKGAPVPRRNPPVEDGETIPRETVQKEPRAVKLFWVKKENGQRLEAPNLPNAKVMKWRTEGHALSRIQAMLTLTLTKLRNLLGLESPQGNAGSQRMCPFCGLITLRRRSHCLECGRRFKLA